MGWLMGCFCLGLMKACEMLEPECLVQMLKAVKHLSMNATLLEVLQNANALDILIRVLDKQCSGPDGTVSELALCFALPLLLCRKIDFTGDTGNVQSHLPNVLQPLPAQQVTAGGGRTGRHSTLPQASDRDKFASQAVCAAHTLRSCSGWEELSDDLVAA